MSEKILVTICNYNHEDYLKQSIESIQNQSYDNLDICVYDDGSKNKDLIRSIINELSSDKRIRFIDEENNIGKWHGLNQAIKTSNAKICTSQDADDISLKYRIEKQYQAMKATQTYHNLCGFYHCWNENDVNKFLNSYNNDTNFKIIKKEDVYKMVMSGYHHPGINHYYTGEVETAGVSSMFYKQLWLFGLRFNPPGMGLRTIMSEDSDFNFRATCMFNSTSILSEKHYLYRRNTSTNKELM
jgi:glycosyltransferase involved in cell wall biosynthesis